ncbi:MAG: 50S ribosomal protein L15 [Candidatus Omnitrophota bacterium]|nr:MAG: 50S ribosomal protein L15 [Candidatus Omnitrophota bacterium]
MDLSKIRIKTKKKSFKRLGRGTGSGKGKTSGRGHKGAGQRAGKRLPYPGFAGGNLPYVRKMPKRGFRPPKRNEYQIVNLRDIKKKIKNVSAIDPATLKKANLIKDEEKPIKILADLEGTFNLKTTFKADSFSKKAKQVIEEVGGKTEQLRR